MRHIEYLYTHIKFYHIVYYIPSVLLLYIVCVWHILYVHVLTVYLPGAGLMNKTKQIVKPLYIIKYI